MRRRVDVAHREYLELFDPEEGYAGERRASWMNWHQFNIVERGAFGSAGDAFDFDPVAAVEVDGPDEAASR
jgi:hypothetical protein